MLILVLLIFIILIGVVVGYFYLQKIMQEERTQIENSVRQLGQQINNIWDNLRYIREVIEYTTRKEMVEFEGIKREISLNLRKEIIRPREVEQDKKKINNNINQIQKILQNYPEFIRNKEINQTMGYVRHMLQELDYSITNHNYQVEQFNNKLDIDIIETIVEQEKQEYIN